MDTIKNLDRRQKRNKALKPTPPGRPSDLREIGYARAKIKIIFSSRHQNLTEIDDVCTIVRLCNNGGLVVEEILTIYGAGPNPVSQRRFVSSCDLRHAIGATKYRLWIRLYAALES
ncbi:hypothetical protein BC938DRAFT_474521 [Jimgerdemannia flammicorona]|uniref:Uncharacterized protein n=1 Tax=Jimgerdemannia flammicorona TaxID=994334 RepID=A0A433QSJ3_9FUNG|nr:hypothetical protein BC938DRAFT_474521 [Jimgerdemannia flammicorona]